MNRLQLITALFFALFTFLVAQDEMKNTLQPLEKLIGGEWHTEGSYQTFEWGVGKLSVIGKGFYPTEDGGRLVSEGVWYYHPGENSVEGFFTAIEMPIQFFDYTSTTFEENKIMSDITAYSSTGGESDFYEVFELTDVDQYNWILYLVNGEKKQKMMEAVYHRKYPEGDK